MDLLTLVSILLNSLLFAVAAVCLTTLLAVTRRYRQNTERLSRLENERIEIHRDAQNLTQRLVQECRHSTQLMERVEQLEAQLHDAQQCHEQLQQQCTQLLATVDRLNTENARIPRLEEVVQQLRKENQRVGDLCTRLTAVQASARAAASTLSRLAAELVRDSTVDLDGKS